MNSKSVLFNESIKNNLIFGREEAIKEYEINYTASSFDELYEIICEWASVS